MWMVIKILPSSQSIYLYSYSFRGGIGDNNKDIS